MDDNIKVRMFCDWDNNSRQLISRLRDQTANWDFSDYFQDIKFVDDDSYERAVVFNYVDTHPGVPTVSLILEPPEILAVRPNPFDIPTWSFCDNELYPTAYGLGFATVPKHHPIKLGKRDRKLCMIVSNKSLTGYHTIRHQIRDALIASGINMSFFGRGMPQIDDRFCGEIPPMLKQLILEDFKFVIDFENTQRNAVTDKFFDPILCHTVPITNSTWLRDNYPKSVEFIDFNWSITEIVEKIRDISINGWAAEYDLSTPRNDILGGRLCLAKWITERVKEL